ncbi:MAG: hypothetical protein KatS3mg082_0875 [Nitrospiraceae bacterium]|nr:MAG: hypothetical protein KatS3mg082_0875 [Nitrospiraceae bacterium]
MSMPMIAKNGASAMSPTPLMTKSVNRLKTMASARRRKPVENTSVLGFRRSIDRPSGFLFIQMMSVHDVQAHALEIQEGLDR